MRTPFLPFLLLFACDVEEPGAVFPEAQLAPPFALAMSPLVPGGPVDITVSGVTPGDSVTLVRSDGGLGAGPCLPFLGGICMEILPGASGYRTTLTGTANSQGQVSWQVQALPPVPPSDLWWQAVVFSGNPGTSNALYNPVVPPGAGCVDDGFEDNDDITSPALVADGTYNNLTVCDQLDPDWYALVLQPGESLDATITFDTSEGDLDMHLWAQPGTRVDSSTGVFATESVSYFNSTNAPLGVAVEVLQFSDPGAPGTPYTLELDVQQVQTCLPDQFEPDNTVPDATPAGPGTFRDLTLCQNSDDDYFAVTLQPGQTLNALAEFDNAEGDIDLYIRTSTNSTLAVSSGSTDDEMTSYTASSTETVYVAVVLFADRGQNIVGNVYDLTLGISP